MCNIKLLRQEICLSVSLSTINTTWTIVALNLELHGYNLLTNHINVAESFHHFNCLNQYVTTVRL